MNKYRIKNCPAISFAGGCQNGKVKVWDCQDCDDCVIKKVVKLCKNLDYRSKDLYNLGKTNMALNILGLLDIQEVE